MTKKIYTDLDATGRTITASAFTGTASSATNADNINISTTTGNAGAVVYPVFVAANTTGNQTPHTDVAGFTYNATANSIQTGAATFTGDVAVNGGDLTTSTTGTASLFNTNATTLNIGGAATTVAIGASGGSTSLNGVTFSGTNATTMTFPTTTATLARTDSAQTFTGNQTFSGQVIANGDIGPNGTNPLTIYTLNQSGTTASTNVIIRSGNQTGTAVSGNTSLLTGTTAGAASGALNVATGAAVGGSSGNMTVNTGTATSFTTGTTSIRTGNATSANSGSVSIFTGTTTTSGTSGNIHINVGTAATTAGSIYIGTAGVSNTVAPTGITIGATGVPITVTGTATFGSTISGSISGNAGTVTNGVYTTDIGSTVQAYDADLGAIAALSGTSGVLKKTAANTWALDTTIPSILLHTPVSNYTIATTTTSNSTITGQAFAVTPTLAASTTYLFESILFVQSTIGSGTGSNLILSWTTGGAGTSGNIQMMVNAGLASLTTSTTTTTSIEITNFSNSTFVSSPSGTQVSKAVIRGIVRTGASSPTIYPSWSVTNSATPGVPTSLTTLVGSYMRFEALTSSGSNVSIGTWV